MAISSTTLEHKKGTDEDLGGQILQEAIEVLFWNNANFGQANLSFCQKLRCSRMLLWPTLYAWLRII